MKNPRARRDPGQKASRRSSEWLWWLLWSLSCPTPGTLSASIILLTKTSQMALNLWVSSASYRSQYLAWCRSLPFRKRASICNHWSCWSHQPMTAKKSQSVKKKELRFQRKLLAISVILQYTRVAQFGALWSAKIRTGCHGIWADMETSESVLLTSRSFQSMNRSYSTACSSLEFACSGSLPTTSQWNAETTTRRCSCTTQWPASCASGTSSVTSCPLAQW